MDDRQYEELREKLEKHEVCLTEYGVRLMQIEETTREIRELTKSVEIIAQKQNYIGEKIDDLSSTVKELDNKPKEKWDKASWAVVGTILTALTGAIVASIIGILH